MKRLLLFAVLLLAGCADSEDNASTNLRKGDEFLARGDYEVAEYYYDRIPEESILYKTVLRRRKEMEKKMASGGGSTAEGGAAPSAARKRAEGVVIAKHSYTLQMGRMPIHTLTVQNNTSKKLNVLELEFVYLDDSGTEVARLTSMVNAGIGADEEKELGKIMPGMVTQKFSKVKIDIKRTLLF